MTLLNDAGIYVIQDLSNPSSSIDRSDPEWNTELFASYAAVVEYVYFILPSTMSTFSTFITQVKARVPSFIAMDPVC